MAYPNRTHEIIEGEGTRQHLMSLYTSYLRTHCPGGLNNYAKKAPNSLTVQWFLPTFASPFEKWDLAYVSTNQDQIAILRSQSGG